MKYFIDTEFIEGPQTKRLLSIPYGKTKPTIDLISIGIVAEDGREYYAISKDFNLKEAWDRYDLVKKNRHQTDGDTYYKTVYWIRENVLKPIHNELLFKAAYDHGFDYKKVPKNYKFSLKSLGILIREYGKSNNQIANDICAFIYGDDCEGSGMSAIEMACKYEISDESLKPEFYAYYADYDWTVFCWLFGKMIDLPKGFPMYCRDLKQMADEEVEARINNAKGAGLKEFKLPPMKEWVNYPKQENEHNALDDAKWNRELFNFLQKL